LFRAQCCGDSFTINTPRPSRELKCAAAPRGPAAAIFKDNPLDLIGARTRRSKERAGATCIKQASDFLTCPDFSIAVHGVLIGASL
jgi:hypothetical protein